MDTNHPTPLQVKYTPHGNVTPWWHCSPGSTMRATAQKRLSNRLLNVIKSLRQLPGLNLPQIQIKFNEKIITRAQRFPQENWNVATINVNDFICQRL